MRDSGRMRAATLLNLSASVFLVQRPRPTFRHLQPHSMMRARALQDAYHDAEQAAVCSALLDHVMQTLEAGEIIDVVGPEG